MSSNFGIFSNLLEVPLTAGAEAAPLAMIGSSDSIKRVGIVTMIASSATIKRVGMVTGMFWCWLGGQAMQTGQHLCSRRKCYGWGIFVQF